jgi:hypothetical protein
MDKTNLSNAERAWKKKSWMDKLNYGNFEAYLASNDWKKDLARKGATTKAAGELVEYFLTVGAVILVLWLVFTGITKGISGVTGFFGDKADHKANCQTHYTVTEATTEFAAKQAYKRCMDN